MLYGPGYVENKQPTYDKPFKVWWLLLIPRSLSLKFSAFCQQSVFVCFARSLEWQELFF